MQLKVEKNSIRHRIKFKILSCKITFLETSLWKNDWKSQQAIPKNQAIKHHIYCILQ